MEVFSTNRKNLLFFQTFSEFCFAGLDGQLRVTLGSTDGNSPIDGCWCGFRVDAGLRQLVLALAHRDPEC